MKSPKNTRVEGKIDTQVKNSEEVDWVKQMQSGQLVTLVLGRLRDYYNSGGSLRELSDKSEVSLPLLYKYKDGSRGESPHHKTIMKLIKALEIPDGEVYAALMVDEIRAKKVVAAEAAFPDVLDDVLDILSSEDNLEAVEKLRAEAKFLKRTKT